MGGDRRLETLGEGRILPLLWRFAWPALITMTLNMLYNVVDRVYIGHGCGADAITGLTMSFPVMMVMGAFGPLIGVGSGTVISISLGEKDFKTAERALGQCVAMKLLLGVTVAPALVLLLNPLLRLMVGDGVTPEAFHYARTYLATVVPFHFLAHLAFGLSACMRAEGSPVSAMRCMVVGAVSNIVLDPLLIFERIDVWHIHLRGFGMGVVGAAWATNAAMALACGAALLHYARGRSVVKLHWRNVRIYRGLAPRVLAIGISPFLMQFAGSTVNFSLNRAFSTWSATPAEGTVQIAAFGILHTVAMLFFMPAMGVQQGFGPIIGYNWGAKNFGRVLKSIELSVALTTIGVSLACAMQLGFARGLAWCIADAPGVTDAGAFAIRIGNCRVWCIGLNVAATTYYQSIGKPRPAIILSLMRQVLVLLPCVWILPRLFPAHAVLAIWLAMPISDFIAFVASIFPMAHERRALLAKIAGTAA